MTMHLELYKLLVVPPNHPFFIEFSTVNHPFWNQFHVQKNIYVLEMVIIKRF